MTQGRKRDKGAIKALDIARRVLKIEADAISALVRRLDSGFAEAVELMHSAQGKVVVSGIGKSGVICQKIASTLASTGTAAFFLHPAEGSHGDLGVLSRGDVLLVISNSGETEELVRLIPAIKRMGLKMVAMTGNMDSTLARNSDVVLDVGVRKEACPMGLAPTASTTASLAMGDALAVAILERRGFGKEQFATLHPAGSLGRRLLKVGDLMHSGDSMPAVQHSASMKEAILEMTAKRLGLTGVFRGERLIGVITDGDLRRALERGDAIFDRSAIEVMTKNPKTVRSSSLAQEAIRIMEEHSITSLFVIDHAKAAGVVHMHDIIRAGAV